MRMDLKYTYKDVVAKMERRGAAVPDALILRHGLRSLKYISSNGRITRGLDLANWKQ